MNITTTPFTLALSYTPCSDLVW